MIRQQRVFLSCLMLSCLGFIPIVHAQEGGEGSTEGGEVFELNPFVVSTQETGWDATETLSGSRMRTKYDDVASQIEVMTMEFMEDFGVNDIEEAAIYSINAENSEEYSSTDDGRQSLSGNLRIRGLSNATKTREFFASYMRPDNYNLERVTITSGPNAILFGTGSPGGVVNSTIARARFTDDSYEFNVQFDDWGGSRYDFLVNKVLIDDVLAVKIAALEEDKRYSVEPASEESRRLYATALFRPFKRTSISFHYEDVEIESRRPARNLPYDLVTVWANAGDLGTVYPNEYIFPNSAQWVSDGSPIENLQVFKMGSANPTLLIGQNPAGIPDVQSYANTVTTEPRTNFDFGSPNEPLVDPVNSDLRGTTFTDGTYYPTGLNQLYLNEGELDTVQIYNIFFNQELTENLFFEAAWQREDYSDALASWMTYNAGTQLQVDANEFLPDGVTPNPYAGELYFEGSDSKYEFGERERDEYRLSLAYDFDFNDHFDNRILRWLGRHQVALL